MLLQILLGSSSFLTTLPSELRETKWLLSAALNIFSDKDAEFVAMFNKEQYRDPFLAQVPSEFGGILLKFCIPCFQWSIATITSCGLLNYRVRSAIKEGSASIVILIQIYGIQEVVALLCQRWSSLFGRSSSTLFHLPELLLQCVLLLLLSKFILNFPKGRENDVVWASTRPILHHVRELLGPPQKEVFFLSF